MSWAGASPVIAGALWSGNAPLVTTRQLVSTVSSITTFGGVGLWANFPAVSTVNLANHNIINISTLLAQDLKASSTIQAPIISTIELYCSSINNSTIILNGSTVTIEKVTITDGRVKADTVQQNTSISDVVSGAADAFGHVASAVHQATSGFLADSGTALQQVLWATYAVDKVVDLANDVTTLATGIQGLINSREQNPISGGSAPGQSAKAYETFNGTTQFQFSTLGAPTWTVFRTTDQQYPNLSLGREILTSTLIPAGTKAVRAISDPIALPILSTQLLSTTNNAQSFGQWAAILGTDYNLATSTLTADNISSLFAEINSLSTAKLTTSSITVLGELTFSTNADNVYDIVRSITSTVAAYDSVSSITQKFLNYQMTLTTTAASESFDMGYWFEVTPQNRSLWYGKQIDYNGANNPQGGYPVIDITTGTYTAGDFFDTKNLANVIGSGNTYRVFNPYGDNFVLEIFPAQFYRFSYSGTAWSYVANPTQTTQTNINSFNIVQRWNNTILSTNNLLTINAGEVNFPGATDTNIAVINQLTATDGYVSTLTVQTGYFSTLYASTSYTQVNVDIFTSTTTAIVDVAYISSISSIYLSTNSMRATTGYVSSLTVDDIVFNRNFENLNTLFTSTLQVSTITGLAGAGGLVNLNSPVYQPNQTFTQFYGSTMLSNNTSNTDARLNPALLYSNIIFTTSTTVQPPLINIVDFSPGKRYTFDVGSTLKGVSTGYTFNLMSNAYAFSTSWLYSQVEFNATTPPIWIAFSTPTMLSANQTVVTLSNNTINNLTILYANRNSTMLGANTARRIVWDGALLQTFNYVPFPDSNYVDTSVIQSGYQNITLSTVTTAVTNNLTVAGTTTWNSNAIRTFNFALSKSQAAPAGGLQTVTTATGVITDNQGSTYNSNVWDFTYSIKYVSVNTPYAISQYYGTKGVDASGNWTMSATLTTATAASLGISLTVGFSLIITMIPRAILQSVDNNIINDLPPGFISTTTLAFPAPNIFMSTITGSTIGLSAGENIYMRSGLSTIPTFIGTGTIDIAANKNINLMANFDINVGASHTVAITGNSTITMTALSSINTVPATYFSGDVRLSSINGSNYPPTSGGTVTSTFTNLYTSTLGGNPLNFLSLVANRSITKTTLSSITIAPRSYFSGDVWMSSLNGAAIGGGGGWVGTATTNLNMGVYDINGSALIINSSNAGDFTIKTQAGDGAIMNLIADSYIYAESRTSEIYFNAATNIGGYAPGQVDFQGNFWRGTSYTGMYITNYGTSGYGISIGSGDRILMNTDYQFTATCSNATIDLITNGGVQITDSSTGGSGTLTVSATNHLYWNGTLIA